VGAMTTGRLLTIAANPKSEQSARVARLFRLTRQAKTRGCHTTSIRIADLEALIAIASAADAGVRP
jgi:hypothetical protein